MSCGHSREARPMASMSDARDSAPAERQRGGSDVRSRRGRMFGATKVAAFGGVKRGGALAAADGPTLADAEPAQHAIASTMATITTRRWAMIASVVRCPGLDVSGIGAFVEPDAEPLDELGIVPGLEDLVELAPVVRDEADAFDGDVVGLPPRAAGEHPVVDGNLGTLPGDDARADNGLVGLHAFPNVRDLLTAVHFDARHVGALQQIAEEAHQLLTLGGRALLPVVTDGALGDLGEVEELVCDLADGGPPFGLPPLDAELRVIQDAKHPLNRAADLLGRRGRRPRRQGDRHREDHRRGGDEETTAGIHRAVSRGRSALTGRRQILAVADSSNGATAAMVIVRPRQSSSVSISPIRRSLISVISIGPSGARLVIAPTMGGNRKRSAKAGYRRSCDASARKLVAGWREA